jgi:hypothetical protein
MPRFYFHLHDVSGRKPDAEGVVLPDAEAAWYQAVRSARDLICEDIRQGGFMPGRRVDIEDEQGQPVWALPFEEVAALAL